MNAKNYPNTISRSSPFTTIHSRSIEHALDVFESEFDSSATHIFVPDRNWKDIQTSNKFNFFNTNLDGSDTLANYKDLTIISNIFDGEKEFYGFDFQVLNDIEEYGINFALVGTQERLQKLILPQQITLNQGQCAKLIDGTQIYWPKEFEILSIVDECDVYSQLMTKIDTALEEADQAGAYDKITLTCRADNLELSKTKCGKRDGSEFILYSGVFSITVHGDLIHCDN